MRRVVAWLVGGRRWLAVSVFAAVALTAAGGAVAAVGGPASSATLRAQAHSKLDAQAPNLAEHAQGAAPSAAVRRARSGLRAALGRYGYVNADARTGGVRSVGRLDGFLTGRSGASAQTVALGWVRSHLAALGLRASDLSDLRLTRDYTSIDGVTHLVWEQLVGGVPLVDSELEANVAANGRLINVGGGARGGLSLNTDAPAIGARSAYATVLRSVGAGGAAPAVRKQSGRLKVTDFAGRGTAGLVAYSAGTGARLAWRVIAPISKDSDQDALIDARTGALVRRSNLVKFANGLVHRNAPGAARGGSQQVVSFDPWLPAGATTLSGNNAHAFLDVNDVVGIRYDPDVLVNTFEEAVPPSGEVHPSSGSDWLYPLQPVPDASGFCPPAPPGCTWNHTTPFSWRINADQATTQLFYFVNLFHDHLLAPPIGFDAASGNFQRSNGGAGGAGGDPVLAQADDGANTDAGLPDGNHQDNANMDTLPDGTAGRMQMYLWEPIVIDPGPPVFAIPFASVNGSDDPSIVYHEYTHGLSNRLITDAQGYGALDDAQSSAMGEAWSDWYALDFINAQGLLPDTAAAGDVDLGAYVGNRSNIIRSEPIDCRPGDQAPACPGSLNTGPGGYTYGDFGNIASLTNTFGFPEPHADGEIWGQTLWQLRQQLIARHGFRSGVRRAEQIITGGMRLGPPDPTYLDERNAILQADLVAGNHDQDIIWRVFASRGMGYFASTTGGEDTAPFQDFSLPPAAGGPTGEIHGIVYDDGGNRVAGVRVGLGGHDAPNVGPSLEAVSAGDGGYKITGVPMGEYLAVSADSPAGFADARTGPVTIAAGGSVRRDLTVRRNYADVRAGASVPGFDLTQGPNHPAPDPRWSNWRDDSGEGCGPAKLFDSNEGTAAETSAPTFTDDPSTPFDETAPRYITVRLAQPVDGAEIWIDPTAQCYGLIGNSLGFYTVSVSRDGNTFTEVSDGHFSGSDLHRLNKVPTNRAALPDGIRYVRLTALRTLGGPDEGGDPLSDAGFMMVSELQVYGRSQPAGAGSPPPASGQRAQLRADLSGTGRRLTVSRAGRVTVRLRCVRATAGALPAACQGTLALRGRLPGHRGRPTLGARALSVAPNRVVTRRIALTSAAMRALRRHSRRMQLRARVVNQGAGSRTATKLVRLRRRAT